MKQAPKRLESEMLRKVWRISILVLLAVFFMSTTAMAAKSGWKQSGSKIYYYLTSDDPAVNGTKATGFQKIGKKYYYFNNSGVLQTGWVSTEDGYRYFRKTGALGTKGAMYTGFKVISQKKYYFDKNGVVVTGYTPLKNNTYYFSKSTVLGERGRALMNTWKTVNGKKYYFGKDGTLSKNCWVNHTYYVGENGLRLTNTVTPDGYLVGSDGKKVGKNKVNGWVKIDGKYHYYVLSQKKFLVSTWKKISGNYYYLDADGIRVTGWKNIGKYRYHFTSKGIRQTGLQTIGGKLYYFDANGRLQKNTAIDGYTIDANGVATPVENTSDKAKILIIAGHGQGDPGAASVWGQERNYTRQFAKLVYDALKSSDKVDVTYYKNGSLSYDCYQQNAATLGSSGLGISSLITGSGKNKTKTLNGIKTNPNIPVFTNYDYVLEIHFNAKGSGKDPQGDGRYTGVGFYINSYKSKSTLEAKIISKINALGFPSWAGGLLRSSTLFNARVCQELGVSYGLLETAFIDDGDDMKFYTSKKNSMAKAVADAIIAYYS